MVYHVLNRGVGRRTLFDKDQMVRSGEGSRSTGRDSFVGAAREKCNCGTSITEDSAPINPEDTPVISRGGGQ